MPNRLSIFATLAVLALAAGGGYVATNFFQQTVPIVPGVQGCARLAGSARQTECLSNEFLAGASKAAGDARDADRDERIIEYVRRTEALAGEDQQLAGLCHPAMHQLGRREGTRAARADRAPEFPTASSQLCTAGYVHGLSEGYLTDSTNADIGAVFPTLCHDEKSRLGCAHGIGHALLRKDNDQTASTATARAIASCEPIPSEFETDCHNGVYMELAMRPDTTMDEYVSTCRSTANVERELACWGYLSLSITTNDVPLNDVPGWCAKSSLPGQYTCLEGYGRNLGVRDLEMCATSADTLSLQKRCLDGAVGLQVGSGHVSRRDATAECKRLDSSELRTFCTDAVGRYTRGRAQVERET